MATIDFKNLIQNYSRSQPDSALTTID